MKPFSIAPLSALFLLLPHVATAQVEPEGVMPANPVALPKVVVKGQKDSAKSRQQAAIQTISVSEEEIERYGDATVGDVLKRLPGISFTGPAGVVKDVRLRGPEKGYTQILINGEMPPTATKDRQLQVDRLPADMIERIEIIRNPSAAYDTNSVGGIINIVLKKQVDGETRLRVAYGQNGDLDVGDAIVQWSDQLSDNLKALVALSHTVSAEDVDEVKFKFDKNNALTATETKPKPSKKTETLFAPRLIWDISDTQQLTLEPMISDGDEDKTERLQIADGKGGLTSKTDKVEYKTDQISRFAGRYDQRQAAGAWYVRFGLQTGAVENDKTENVTDVAKNKVTLKTEQEQIEEQAHYLEIGGHYDLPQQVISAGLGLRHNSFDNQKTKTENGADKSEAKENFNIDEQKITAFVQDEWQVAKDHWLTAGVRGEWTQRDAQVSTGLDLSDNDHAFSPSLHYRVALNPHTNLRASAGLTRKLPKFDQLNPFIGLASNNSLTSPDKAGNSSLRAEEAASYELGTEYFFAKKQGVLGLNLYQRDVSDYVEKQVRLEGGRFVERPYNVGEAQFYGAELDLRTPLVKGRGHHLDLIANHTEMRGEISQHNGITREVKDMPRRTSNLGLDYQHRPTHWNAGVSVNHTPAFSRTSLNDGNELERKRREAYTLLDAYVGKKLSDRYEFRLIGRNLLSVEKDETTDKLNTDGSLKSREQKVERSEPTFYLTLETRF